MARSRPTKALPEDRTYTPPARELPCGCGPAVGHCPQHRSVLPLAVRRMLASEGRPRTSFGQFASTVDAEP